MHNIDVFALERATGFCVKRVEPVSLRVRINCDGYRNRTGTVVARVHLDLIAAPLLAQFGIQVPHLHLVAVEPDATEDVLLFLLPRQVVALADLSAVLSA